MGCNCGKRKPPLGVRPANSNQSGSATPSAVTSGMVRGSSAPASQPNPSTNDGRTQSFALDTGNGATQTFGSRLEADAAWVRGGRVGTVRPLDGVA